MHLYEINRQILDCIDFDTGEITNTDKYDALQISKSEKLENIALWVKNLLSEAEALKAEEKAFAERRKASENKAESLKRYLDTALKGQKFSTTKVAISYRKSTAVEVDESKLPANWMREIPATHVVDKVEITKALKSGEKIAGAELIERNNIQIK